MAYSSPTVIYSAPLINGFVIVIDVSGQHAVQTYQSSFGGLTSLQHSELWTSGDKAIAAARKIQTNTI